MNRRSVWLSCLSLLLCFGCTTKQQAPAPKTESATSGTLQIVADEALRPAVDSLIQGFMLENPNAKLTVKYESAGQAVEDLLNQKARIILIDRHLVDVERQILLKAKLTLPAYDMAEDGFGVLVSAKNPTEAISVQDLQGIYRNQIKDWSQLKSSVHSNTQGGSVHLVLPPFASSTAWTLDSIFLGPDAFPKGAISRFSTTDSLIAAIRRDPNALTFIGSAWKHRLDVRHDSSVKVIPLIPDGSDKAILLHPAYIYEKLYPIVTPVTAYTFESPNTLPRGFLAYAMTAHGQMVFKNYDILPKTQIIKLVPSGD